MAPVDIFLPDLHDVTGFGLDWMAGNFYFTDGWKKTLTVCSKGKSITSGEGRDCQLHPGLDGRHFLLHRCLEQYP